ncbi:helix-turn-helix transcriptional regulator [Acinetobacter sp. ANC 4558]|uniref:helix-turn-helix transcriptional regulator n=1 Tax=Acinetobacter sp. ANC 4558 TaxID=1977876 RepID=UPI000A332CE2|nr:helix-turn-helix transcriptional regulator [Acinetobacter sp. ANC 4558]OTG85452.1 helix-turn-helix transcriptional regulator [Acinetobacter sp. ANC 4558]
MLNHHFLAEFSQNFISQVHRVLEIDAYLIYSINTIDAANNYHAHNIPKDAVNEYINYKMNNDPVSYQHFYHHTHSHVELLNHYDNNMEYFDFIHRWKIGDTAEIFFRKRNGDPVFGLSLVRKNSNRLFSLQDKNILESFYSLSEKYFHHHADTIDKELLIDQYSLTKKELIVLEQVFDGLDNNLIAQQLNCSLATIKTHIQHIYQKTNVKNRHELLCRFLK